MMQTIKAEFRKLLTIRSTYFISVFVLLLDIFFAFYLTGWRMDAADLHNPATLASQVTSAASLLALFSALIGVILLTQEYRYNTILYTLTASRSRTKVLFAKAIVMSIFAIVFITVVSALSPLLTLLAVHLHGQALTPQHIPYLQLLWRVIFYGWGFAIMALAMAAIIRIQVGAIAVLFLVPGTIEQIAGIFLKNDRIYLPFTALSSVLDTGPVPISHLHALVISSVYIVVFWLVAWVLFIRRDAN